MRPFTADNFTPLVSSEIVCQLKHLLRPARWIDASRLEGSLEGNFNRVEEGSLNCGYKALCAFVDLRIRELSGG